MNPENSHSQDNTPSTGASPAEDSNTLNQSTDPKAETEVTLTAQQRAHALLQEIQSRITSQRDASDSSAEYQANENRGELQNYATDISGRAVSQDEFASRYMTTVSKIADLADRYIEQGLSYTQLSKQRTQLIAQAERNAGSTSIEFDGTDEDVRSTYEKQIRSEILRLSDVDISDKELQARATNLAMLILGNEDRTDKIAGQLEQTLTTRLTEQAGLLKVARSMAKDEVFTSRYKEFNLQSEAEATFLIYCDLALQTHGHIPRLEVFNDFDGNFTIDHRSGRSWKPGSETNKVIDAVDSLTGLPAFVRLTTTESAGLNPHLKELSARLEKLAAHDPVFFDDVPAVLAGLKQCKAYHKILTQNANAVVHHALEQVTGTSLSVAGMSETTYNYSKPEAILDWWAGRNEISITIVSDDNDPSLIRHLKNPHDETVRWPEALPPLQSLVFFAGRAHDRHAPSNGGYGVLQTARENNGLCVENKLTMSEGDRFGLQGQKRLIDLYSNWRGKRLREGFESSQAPPQDLSSSPKSAYFVGAQVQASRKNISADRFTPTFETKDFLHPVQSTKVLDNGVVNQQFFIGCPGTWLDPETGDTYIYYKGTDPYFKDAEVDPPELLNRQAVSGIYASRISADGKVGFWNGSSWNEKDQTKAVPVLQSSDPKNLAPHGLEDARVTQIGDGQFLVTANALNKDEFRKSLAEAGGNKKALIRGAHTEVFKGDIRDPQSMTSLGNIGPDYFFKNVVIFPRTFDVNGEESHLLLTRQLPDIQCIPLPAKDLERIAHDDEFRTEFWDRCLGQQVDLYTLLAPTLPHEGKNNPNDPGGQIASGVPPLEVSYFDHEAQETKKYWLLVYNSVPDFQGDDNKSPYGRVVNAALVDYDNPWQLVARGSHPIIVPRTDDALKEDGHEPRYSDIAFATGGDIDGEGNLNVWYTDGDVVVTRASCPAKEIVSWLLLHDDKGQLQYKPDAALTDDAPATGPMMQS
jgi:predicted GH43/DUF377 family glycosyl hydrolase